MERLYKTRFHYYRIDMKQRWRDVYDGIINWRTLTQAQHRKALHSMRRNVINSLEFLDSIFENIPNMTDDPGLQFEMIFKERERLLESIQMRVENRLEMVAFNRRTERLALEGMCKTLGIPVSGITLLDTSERGAKYAAEMEGTVQKVLGTSRRDLRRRIAREARWRLS